MGEIDHLNPALSGKYRIKDTHLPRVLNTPVGDVHFGTLTEEQAEKLCDAGFDYLERIPAEKPKAKKSESTEGTPPASEGEGQQEQDEVSE